MPHLHSPNSLIGAFLIPHAPPSLMAYSPFLSAAAAVDLAGLDLEWLPNSSTKPSWKSEPLSGRLPSSPPQPQPIRRSTNGFLLHDTFGFLNPSLKTNDLLHHTSSASSPPPPSASADNILNRPPFPTGDFKKNYKRGESPVSCESSITIEGMSRACRYSPEEKKQRIERYRSKRNKRNFNKKIKYACRKSLADSRPRIRGRFARYNDDDTVKNYPVQWSHGRDEEEEDQEEANGGDNWLKYFIDAYSSNLIP